MTIGDSVSEFGKAIAKDAKWSWVPNRGGDDAIVALLAYIATLLEKLTEERKK